jgi:hypothetical protein
MKKLTLLPALLVVAGCITSGPLPGVRLTMNPEVVRGCEFRGTLKSRGGSTGNVERQLFVQAVAVNANTIFMASENSNSGEAYLCPDPAATVRP